MVLSLSFKRFLFIFIFMVLTWGMGLSCFLYYILTDFCPSSTPAEAIIILTGGHGRVEKGFELLKKIKQPVFISGVARRVQLHDLLKVHPLPMELNRYIEVDSLSLDTQDNARQTAHWVQKNGYNSIILVTSYYHIPRSLIEFKRFAPHLKIIPYPIFPKRFSSLSLFKKPLEWKTIIEEYHKYCIARFRHFLNRYTFLKM